MPEITTASRALPIGGTGRLTTGWWGMACLLATEGILFAYLIFSYAYLGAQAPQGWPPGGPPSLKLALPNTVLLLASSLVLEVGHWRFRARREKTAMPALLLTAAMGIVFILVQLKEWTNKGFGFATDAYSSSYFTLTGFHLAHVIAGVIALVVLSVWAWQQRFPHEGSLHLMLGRIYWHFVDLVWLVVFTTVYLVPQHP